LPEYSQTKTVNNSTQAQEPPINWEGLQQSCGKEGALEILRIFVESSSEILDRLSAALDTKDFPIIKSTVHELRGASVSVGFPQMAAVCKELEEIARKHNLNDANKIFVELKFYFEKVVAFSEQILVSKI
jgi:HPt (histidine-containing phosphotransfer) domain-containing protein